MERNINHLIDVFEKINKIASCLLQIRMTVSVLQFSDHSSLDGLMGDLILCLPLASICCHLVVSSLPSCSHRLVIALACMRPPTESRSAQCRSMFTLENSNFEFSKLEFETRLVPESESLK